MNSNNRNENKHITNDPWIKLILVSLGGIMISLALLLPLQQFTSYSNGYSIQGKMNESSMQQGTNTQMDSMTEHTH